MTNQKYIFDLLKPLYDQYRSGEPKGLIKNNIRLPQHVFYRTVSDMEKDGLIVLTGKRSVQMAYASITDKGIKFVEQYDDLDGLF